MNHWFMINSWRFLISLQTRWEYECFFPLKNSGKDSHSHFPTPFDPTYSHQSIGDVIDIKHLSTAALSSETQKHIVKFFLFIIASAVGENPYNNNLDDKWPTSKSFFSHSCSTVTCTSFKPSIAHSIPDCTSTHETPSSILSSVSGYLLEDFSLVAWPET